jgi:hypothetical protein
MVVVSWLPRSLRIPSLVALLNNTNSPLGAGWTSFKEQADRIQAELPQLTSTKPSANSSAA